MPLGPIAVHFGLLALAAGVNGALAVYAYRYRSVPGATAFAALTASIAWWVGTYTVSLLVFDPGWRLVMERVQWFGAAAAPVALLVFALSYTGHEAFLTRRRIAAVAAIPAGALVLVWLNPGEIMYMGGSTMVKQGVSLIAMDWGLGFWVFVVYSYSLIAVAAALLLRLVVVSEYLYADQAALVLVGIVAPFLGSVWDLLGPNGVVLGEVAPFAFGVTGIAFGFAVFDRRLFEVVPATRQLGRRSAIGQLEDGVLIVDTDRRVVYANEAAGDILDCEVSAAVGRPVEELVADDRIDFDTVDALAEIERDDRVYEVRTSPIADRRGRTIGHTLVLNDVTSRKRREQRLATQRDELARLEELNGVLRGVNQALVSAGTREEIHRAVADRLAGADRYRAVCLADAATWSGSADRWTVAGEAPAQPPRPDAAIDGDVIDGSNDIVVRPAGATADAGSWVVVPIAYGRTVFGAIGLLTDREETGERELSVLAELGETVGHAIHAVEHRQLLSGESVVELELRATEDGAPLAAATAEGGRLELNGIVPTADGESIAYLEPVDGDPAALRERLAAAATGSVRAVDGGSPIEWRTTGDSLLGTLADHGARVTAATTEGGVATVEVEVASGKASRSLHDHLDGAHPDVDITAKREQASPAERAPALEPAQLETLTDRQRAAIEAAYRAGYFDWPRESTAEEVADALGIAPSTLHGHLRKAERTVFASLLEDRE